MFSTVRGFYSRSLSFELPRVLYPNTRTLNPTFVRVRFEPPYWWLCISSIFFLLASLKAEGKADESGWLRIDSVENSDRLAHHYTNIYGSKLPLSYSYIY